MANLQVPLQFYISMSSSTDKNSINQINLAKSVDGVLGFKPGSARDE